MFSQIFKHSFYFVSIVLWKYVQDTISYASKSNVIFPITTFSVFPIGRPEQPTWASRFNSSNGPQGNLRNPTRASSFHFCNGPKGAKIFMWKFIRNEMKRSRLSQGGLEIHGKNIWNARGGPRSYEQKQNQKTRAETTMRPDGAHSVPHSNPQENTGHILTYLGRPFKPVRIYNITIVFGSYAFVTHWLIERRRASERQWHLSARDRPWPLRRRKSSRPRRRS